MWLRLGCGVVVRARREVESENTISDVTFYAGKFMLAPSICNDIVFTEFFLVQ